MRAGPMTILATLALATASCIAVKENAVPARPTAFTVATDGSDESPGTEAKPFKSLERARDAIRALKKSGGLPEGGVTVWIRGGTYPLTASFELTQEDSGTLQDVIEDTSYIPERELLRENLRERTLKFLETLLEKEKQILLYRFAFYGGKKYTLKKIGDEMGISPETVRQIEIRALRKLKENAEELREFVYT